MADHLLPPVVGELKAKIDDFKKKMGEARAEMAKTESDGKSHLGGLTAGLAIGFGGAAVAVGAFAKSSVSKFDDVAGAVAKMQRLTGGSAEEMSRLRFAAQETGVSTDTLTKGMVKLSAKVEAGNKAFAENGINIRDAKGHLLSMGDVLANTAEKFAAMPNGIEKNALAVKLFGRSGVDLLPLLNKGKEGLAEFGAESDKFGLTLGQDNVDAFKKNIAAHRTMHAAWEGLQVQLGSKIMPIVAQITSWLASHLPAAMAFVKRAIDALTPAFTFLSSAVEVAFKAISAGISWLTEHKEVLLLVAVAIGTVLVAAFVAWATAAGAAAIASLAALAPIIEFVAPLALLAAGVVYAYTHFKVFREVVDAVKDGLVTAWQFVSDKVIPIFVDIVEIAIKPMVLQFKAVKAIITDVVIPAFEAVWNFISTKIIPVFKSIIDTMINVGQRVGEIVGNIVDFFTGLPSRIVNALSDLASTLLGIATTAIGGLWTGLSDAVEAGWKWLTDLPGKFADGFGKIPGAIWSAFKSAWNAIADFFTFKIPQITIPMPPGVPDIHFGGGTVALLPHLARGGRITESGLAVINENSSRGAETVYLPKGAEVVPNGPGRAGGGGHTFVTNNYGITDHQELARAQASELIWQFRLAG